MEKAPFICLQVEFLLKAYWKELRDLEVKYEQFGVELRLRLKEFSAPPRLKDEVEASIMRLLSNSVSVTFKSDPLPADTADATAQRLQAIARKNCCYLTADIKSKHRCCPIPKAASASARALLADDFLLSPDVFRRIEVENGSIEIRLGDIALQKVSNDKPSTDIFSYAYRWTS